MGEAPSVTNVDGELVINWPAPRPQSFEITAEVFEMLIGRANAQPLPDSWRAVVDAARSTYHRNSVAVIIALDALDGDHECGPSCFPGSPSPSL